MARQTLHRKTVSVVMLTCFVTLFISGLAYVTSEFYWAHQQSGQELKRVATLLAPQITRAINHNALDEAHADLEILSGLRNVQAASIVLPDEDIHIEYQRPNVDAHSWLGLRFWLPDGHASQRLALKDHREAILTIQADYSELRESLLQFIAVGIVTLVLAMGLAWWLAGTLYRSALHPIQMLVEAARRIGSSHDYRVRVPMAETVEIAILIDAFNHMIARVQKQNQAVEDVKNYLYDIIDSMPSGLAAITKDKRVVYINQTACQLAGLPAESAIGSTIHTIIPFLALYLEHIDRAMDSKQTETMPRFTVNTDTGPRTYRLVIYPLSHTEGAVVRIEDATEQVKLESQIIQTEKMHSLGGLAAGMAHEINNPLAGILQSAQNIARRLRADEPANQKAAQEQAIDINAVQSYLDSRQIPEFLGGIRELGHRISAIVQGMLQFSRQSHAPVIDVNAVDLIQEAVTIAKHDPLIKSLPVHYQFPNTVPNFWCVPSEIQQVLINMIKNAAQAMEGQEDPAPQLEIAISFDDHSLYLEVADNGPGIDEATRSRIFEPFFTTKAESKGTGLGLSIAYFIIKNRHHGDIDVKASRWGGTSFRIRLPREAPPESDA